jgi:hypothetical protein
VTFKPRICPRALAVLLAALDDLHGGALLVELEVEAAIHGGEDGCIKRTLIHNNI